MNPAAQQLLKLGLSTLSMLSPHQTARLAGRMFSRPRRHAYTPTPAQLETLAAGTAVTVAGLSATTWGSGPTVALFHGWQRSRHAMTAFVSPLVLAGYRVIATDAPAHGESPGRQMTPFQYARAVQRVENALGGLHAAIAHSMGGFALLQSLQEGMALNRAVLLAPATLSLVSNPLSFAKRMGLNAATIQCLLEESAREANLPMDQLGFEHLGQGLHVPALFFHDPADQRVPYDDSRTTSRAWAQAQLETVHGLGHGGILSDPATVARAVEFITE